MRKDTKKNHLISFLFFCLIVVSSQTAFMSFPEKQIGKHSEFASSKKIVLFSQEQQIPPNRTPQLYMDISWPGAAKIGETVTITYTIANFPFEEVELPPLPTSTPSPTATAFVPTPTSNPTQESLTSTETSADQNEPVILIRTIIVSLIGGVLGLIISWISNSRVRNLRARRIQPIPAALIGLLIGGSAGFAFFTFFGQNQQPDIIVTPISSVTPFQSPTDTPIPTESPEDRLVQIVGDQSPVGDVQVFDDLSNAIDYLEGDINANGLLDKGEKWIFVASYQVIATDPDPLVFNVTVSGRDLDGDSLQASKNFTIDLDYAPVVNISKEAPSSAKAGETITYTYKITNENSEGDGSPVQEVRVEDSEAGIAFYASGDTNEDERLDVGETWVFTLTHTIPLNVPETLDSEATIYGLDMDNESVTASTQHTLTVSFGPVVSIDISAPAVANAGEVIIYTITITNDQNLGDNSPVLIETVIDNEGENAQYKDGDTNNNSLLDGQEKWVYFYERTILPTDPDPVEAVFKVNGLDQEGDPVTASESSQVAVEYNPALALQVFGPPIANLGETVLLTATLTNSSTGDGSRIDNPTVSNIAGENARLVRGDTNRNSQLEVGENWEYEIPLLISNTTSDIINNQLDASGIDLDGDSISTTNTISLEVAYNPQLTVLKNGAESITLNHESQYTITVQHDPAISDGSPVGNILVSDSLMQLPTYITGDSNNDQVLEEGEIWQYKTSFIPTSDTPEIIENTIEIQGTDLDGDPLSATGNFNLNIDYQPILRVTTLGPVQVDFGQVVTITYEVQNDSSLGDGSAVQSILLQDNVRGIASYVSGDTNQNDSLEVGETWTFVQSYTPSLNDPNPFNTSGTVTGRDLDGDSVQSESSHLIAIAFKPAFFVKVNAPLSGEVGDSINVEVLVTNDGVIGDNSPIKNLNVRDDQGNIFDYQSGDRLNDKILGSGETWTYSLKHTIQSDDSDPLTGKITISGADLEEDLVQTSDAYEIDLLYKSSIQIQRITPDNATIGERFTYDITIFNDETQGDGTPVKNLNVNFSIGGNATYLDGDNNQNGILESGEIWKYLLTYTPTPDLPDTLVNKVTINGETPDGNPITTSTLHELKLLRSFVNGGFEDANLGWTLIDGGLPASIIQDNTDNEPDIPIGRQAILLGDPDLPCSPIGIPTGYAAVEQRFTVPNVPPGTQVGLRFKYVIYTQDISTRDTYDRFEVVINDSNTPVFADGNLSKGQLGCNLWQRVPGPNNQRNNTQAGWGIGYIDLKSFVGQTILISFRNYNRLDGWYNTYTYLDDIVLITGR